MVTTQSTSQTLSKKLQDKVALVTGASSGIGMATAQALADEGAKIVLAARREDRLTAIADTIHQAGGSAVVLPVDLADEQAVCNMVEQGCHQWGRLDILVE